MSIFLVFPESIYPQLTNQNLKGLKARSVDEVLALSDEEIDLTTAILLISQRGYKDFYQTDIDIKKYRKKIDEMALALSKKIGTERNPKKIVQIMNHYLFQKQKFSVDKTSSASKNPENLFLNSVLNRKKGRCVGLSILYLTIAERIGLPLYGVSVPGHFFVRYEDKKNRINIETTNKGRLFPDNYWRKIHKIPESSFYLKSLSKKETIGVFLKNFGKTYADKRMLDKAIIQYKRVLTINPDDAEIHNNLGVVYGEKRMLYQAISEFEKALDINPDLAETYVNIGSVYGKKEMLDEAISAYKEAIRLKPDDAFAHYNLGYAYYKKGFYDEAMLEYRKAIELKPDDAEAHYYLGNVYYYKGLYDQAIGEYNEAIRLKPDFADVHINLGVIYSAKGLYGQAITEFRKAIEIKPDDPDIYYNLACIFSLKGNKDEAIRYLTIVFEKGYRNYEHVKQDRDLDNIRDDTRYKKLMLGK